MVPLNKLDSKSIMSREVLDEVFNQIRINLIKYTVFNCCNSVSFSQ